MPVFVEPAQDFGGETLDVGVCLTAQALFLAFRIPAIQSWPSLNFEERHNCFTRVAMRTSNATAAFSCVPYKVQRAARLCVVEAWLLPQDLIPRHTSDVFVLENGPNAFLARITACISSFVKLDLLRFHGIAGRPGQGSLLG